MTFDDPRITAGIELFNAREFFACHDILEDYWGDLVCRERTFFQGLIQTAVALHHFEEGNLGGALRMYQSARRCLLPWQPALAGIDVEKLVLELDECFDELAAPHSSWPDHVRLHADRVPTIHRQDEHVPPG